MSTLAAGIEVSPEKLEFELAGESLTKNLIVVNPTADVQIFEVYADDFQQVIDLKPQSFTLQAGERKNVAVTLQPQKMPAAVISTNLSVVGKPLADSKVQVNTGVKIPLTVKTSASKAKNFATPTLFLLAGVIIVGLSYLLRSRQPSSTIKP